MNQVRSNIDRAISSNNEAPASAKGIEKLPNYTFPKETLANAVGAVALAILAVVVFVHSPLPVPLGSVYSICLIGICLSWSLAAALKAHIAYGDNRAKAEYEFAMSNKTANPVEYQKWLEKAANERCYRTARLELAENTADDDTKVLQVNLLTLTAKDFKTLSPDEQKRVAQLVVELRGKGKKLFIDKLLKQ